MEVEATSDFDDDDDDSSISSNMITTIDENDEDEKVCEKEDNSKKKGARKMKPRKRRKGTLKKIVAPTKNTKDVFVQSRVAFNLDGDERPSWLGKEYKVYGKSISGRRYLFGIVLQREKTTNSSCI